MIASLQIVVPLFAALGCFFALAWLVLALRSRRLLASGGATHPVRCAYDALISAFAPRTERLLGRLSQEPADTDS